MVVVLVVVVVVVVVVVLVVLVVVVVLVLVVGDTLYSVGIDTFIHSYEFQRGAKQ